MIDNCFIPFKSSLKNIKLNPGFNDPFVVNISDIAKVAAKEFQQHIATNEPNWNHNFGNLENKTGLIKGKMFGVLVVRNKQMEIGYLRAVSGKLMNTPHDDTFAPSVFDDSTDDFHINKSMSELTAIGKLISESSNPHKIEQLKVERNIKSNQLQKWLFEHYYLINKNNEAKNILAIFKSYNNSYPPSAAGECAAPKLLHHAFKQAYEVISIAEFWWGASKSSDARIHKNFYPACSDKCRPILDYMLS